MRRRWIYVFLLALPLVGWILHLGEFIYPLRSLYSDLTISHLPNLLFLRRALLEWGQVPLWSNTILSGYPFVANPLSGLWYPPGWLAILLPQPLGLNLVLLVHVLWGGWGMFRFLESRGLRPQACWLGALTFLLMPKLMAHLAAGHVTLVYALSWTPWLLWAERRRFAGGSADRLLPGWILTAIVLADLRWAAYAVLLWGGYTLALRHGVSKRHWFSSLLGTAGLLLMALLLAAPLLLPFGEYVGLSTRQALTPEESFTLSLPPEKLLGLLIPDFNGYAEWIVYPGAWALLSWVYHAATPDLRRRNWPWMVLVVLGLVYALGSAVPYLELLAKLPGWGLMRVPSRAVFLSGIGLAVLAADSVQRLMDDQAEIPFPDPFFFMTPVIGFVVLLSWGMRQMGQELPTNFVWAAVALLVCGGLVFARQRRWLPAFAWSVLLSVVCAVDLAGVMLQSVQFRSPAQVYGEGGQVAKFLAGQSSGLFRVYSPSYAVSQQAAARWGLEFASGIDPLQLTGYANFMAQASGVPIRGYDVTLPPLQGETVADSNRGIAPDLDLLGLLNVRYLVLNEDLKLDGVELVQRWGETRVYQNQRGLPRAWVQDPMAIVGTGVLSEAEVRWTPNRVTVWADGPGLLVLSEIAYPGWRVWVDGQQVEAQSPAGILRGVMLTSGRHEVRWSFSPLTVWLGLGIGLLTALSAVVWQIKHRKGSVDGNKTRTPLGV